MEPIMIASAAGSALVGAAFTYAAQRSRQHKSMTVVKDASLREQAAFDETTSQARLDRAAQDEYIADLEASIGDLEGQIQDHAQRMNQMESDLQTQRGQRTQWLQQAAKIVGEAGRLKALAATFERWHDQMHSLMVQNREMHDKNDELSSIARHVVIVSLNASIEASRAGPAGCGFSVVANEVRELALRTEGLSRDTSSSLYRSDLTTTATFQDIQAGGKMLMASLSGVEALSSNLESQLGGS